MPARPFGEANRKSFFVELVRLKIVILRIFLSAFAYSRKVPFCFMSVRPTVVMNLAAPTGRISVNCYVRDLQEICRANSNLVQMRQKYHGTLPVCRQQHKIAVKSIFSSQTVKCLMCLHGRMVALPRPIVTLHVHCLPCLMF